MISLELPSSLHSSNYEHTLSRLQRLAFPSHLESSLTSPALFSATPCSGLSSHKVRYSPPFSHSYVKTNDAYEDNAPIIIDTFAPRPVPLDLSPTSSASSDLDSTSSHSTASKSSFEAFFCYPLSCRSTVQFTCVGSVLPVCGVSPSGCVRTFRRTNSHSHHNVGVAGGI